jgi:hypothetical protein
VHAAVCGSVSGGVRCRLKLSGNLSTALCNGVAMCSSAHIFVRQWADMCGSAHIFVQQWVDMCGSVTRRVHSGCVHQCVREMMLTEVVCGCLAVRVAVMCGCSAA